MNACEELLKLAPSWFPGFLALVLLAYNTWLTRRAAAEIRAVNGKVERGA